MKNTEAPESVQQQYKKRETEISLRLINFVLPCQIN